MLIPKAGWINPQDTREFEFQAENYTISILGTFGFIKPNTRAVSVIDENNLETFVEDPGIVAASLGYCGEKVYLILRLIRLSALGCKSRFRPQGHRVIMTNGNDAFDWEVMSGGGDPIDFYWYSANWLRPSRAYWKDDFRNLVINKDSNLDPQVEQVFPIETVNSSTMQGGGSPYSLAWRSNSARVNPYIPWADVPTSGVLNFDDCYHWGSWYDDQYPLPDRPIPPLIHLGKSINSQLWQSWKLKRYGGRSATEYIFRMIDSAFFLSETAIELGAIAPPCDIPITVDPQFRDTGHFCMSHAESNTLMTRFPQMNQNINITNNLLRESL